MIYVFVFLALAVVSYYILKDFNHFKNHGIPYIQPVPGLGNMAPLFFRRKTMCDYLQSLYNMNGDAKYIGVYDLTKPVVMLRDLGLIKSVTLKHFDAFMDHVGFVDEVSDPFFGKNLFSLRGERWREIRAVLSPAFTSSKMKGMFTLMSECAVDFCDSLRRRPPGERITDMKDIFTRYTNDVIATCAFGVKVDSMKDPTNNFFVYGREATNFNTIGIFLKMLLHRILPWLGRIIPLTLISSKITSFFRSVLEDIIRTRDANGIVRPDMLQLMMDARNKEKNLTIDDMVAQAFIFFFGGFESTSLTMCFVAYEVAVNPDVQERLQREIDQVLDETNGETLYQAINAMEYLDAVVSETLRKYPITGIMDRLCVEDFELHPTLPGVKPYTMRKDQGMWIPIYAIHHDPKYFEEPSRFDPERFLGKRRRECLESGAYFPFGLGPRMCIGNRFALLEIKILFFHLLARCDLKPCEKTSIPLKFSKSAFTLQPEEAIWLTVAPRETPHRTVSETNNS